MSDLEQRLRRGSIVPETRSIMTEAADRIHQLEEFAQWCAEVYPGWTSERIALIRQRARTALKETPNAD